MARVMISYRQISGQREFAAMLEKDLASAGLETWLDQKNIPPGANWEDEIFRGIVHSDYVILCLSPEYFQSEYCLFECYIARGYGKHLLPIIVPHEGTASVLDLIDEYEETKGIDQLNLINFKTHRFLGLVEDYTKMVQRIIKAIHNPTPIDIDYDVYFSFRTTQAQFATQIADDLNKDGVNAFIHTRAIDVGVDWRRVSWNATLRSEIHIVILSPEVHKSKYIKNEVLVMRTKQDAKFIPILAREFANDQQNRDLIRQSFANSTNLSILNKIQWYIPNQVYPQFIEGLIKDIKTLLTKA